MEDGGTTLRRSKSLLHLRMFKEKSSLTPQPIRRKFSYGSSPMQYLHVTKQKFHEEQNRTRIRRDQGVDKMSTLERLKKCFSTSYQKLQQLPTRKTLSTTRSLPPMPVSIIEASIEADDEMVRV